MKKMAQNTIQCSICKDRVLLESFLPIFKKVLGPTQGFDKKVHQYIYDTSYPKACGGCIQEKKAILARPEKQLYGLGGPRLVYIDSNLHCVQCKKDFTFSAKEQQTWFEKYKIWVSSAPIRCLSCRKKETAEKKKLLELQKELAQADQKNPLHLIQISQLYTDLGKRDKALKFLRQAKNLTQQSGRKKILELEIQRLQIELDSLKK